MARKFKCKDCRHSFQLNNGEDEICPKCKSDNILPVGNGMSILGKLLLFLVMATVGYFATDIILKNNNDNKLVAADEISSDVDTETNKESVSEDILSSGEVQTDMTIVDEPMEPIDSAEFTISNITLKQDGFSFFVQCGKIPVDYQVEQYQLFLNEKDVEPMLTADANGEFKSSKYLADDGKYYVKAIFINNNTTTLKPIEGIVKPATPAEVVKPKRMEKDELESKLNEAINAPRGSNFGQWYKNNGDKRIKGPKAKIAIHGDATVIEGVHNLVSKARTASVYKNKKVKVTDVTYSDNIITAFEVSFIE